MVEAREWLCRLLRHRQQRQVKLWTMSMRIQKTRTRRSITDEKAQKSDPGSQTEKLVPLFRRVAAGATRRGHAEVACGGEEALPELLADPQGHTAALAETEPTTEDEDETSLRMIPVSATGWSVTGEKTKQVHSTLAIFGGKTQCSSSTRAS